MKDDSVNIEFIKIFGGSQKFSLYDKDDEEYNSILQLITTTNSNKFNHSKLPFDDIEAILTDHEQKIINNELHKNDYNLHNKYNLISNIISALKIKKIDFESIECIDKNDIDDNAIPDLKKHHTFSLSIQDRCYAFGYYCEDTKNFFICKNSLISKYEDLDYTFTSSSTQRQKIIAKWCDERKLYIKVLKDIKCRSAYSAACYVIGGKADVNLWKDKNGKTLHDIYS